MFRLFRRRNATRKGNQVPPWAAWAMIAVVLYAMYASQQQHSPAPENTGQPALMQATREKLAEQIAPLDKLKDRLTPSAYARLSVRELVEGEGESAVCGQQARVRFGSNPDEAPSEETTFTIGQGKAVRALEQGTIGLKQGGQRVVRAREEAGGDATTYRIELLGLSPSLAEANAQPFRIIDTQPNTGGMVLCGNSARVHVEIWSAASGEKLYSTRDKRQPVEFTPGASEVFLGLEQGVIGMATGSTRMLVVPPAFLATMNGNAPLFDFNLPKAGSVLVEVEAL
jgi:FKBP-type peptidyl-prolyl cis-trans isomerase